MNGDPLPVELLVSDHQRRLEIATSAQKPIEPDPCIDPRRERCLNRIRCNVGEGGLRAFLSQAQPAFGGMTGADVVRNQPGELLRRLDDLEHGLGNQCEDEPEFDPAIPDHPPQTRSGKKIDSVLAILDELELKQGRRTS